MQRREHPWIARDERRPTSIAHVGAIGSGTGALMTIGGGLLGGWLGYHGHAPKWIGSGVGAIGGATIGGAAGFFLYKLISDPSTAV